MSKPVVMIPGARRVIKSLRDMGYDFSQAVADIVDNSVAANAKHVSINVEFDGDASWVRIWDDGSGMSPKELLEAMRYGTEREYEGEELGKFGLGLKTASMSQCRRLTVASRRKGSKSVAAFAWDLDHIEKTNRWEVLTVKGSASGPSLHRMLDEHSGTVVLWQRLDRILGYKHPYGELANKRIAQMCRELEQHLSMVFHRFLAGERKPHLRISVNGNDVRPWDPFCRDEPKTLRLKTELLRVEEDAAIGEIRVESYIVPHEEDFSSPSARKRAAGPAGWNQQQGFYVYRNGRMIQSGGWSRIRKVDEHTKLARVAIYFPSQLDEAFKINVAKMSVQMPASIRDELDSIAKRLTKAARKAYDRKERALRRLGGRVAHFAPDAKSRGHDAEVGRSGSEAHPIISDVNHRRMTFREWSEFVLDAAVGRDKPSVEQAIARAAKRLEKH
jgi:hypothetical protein